MKSGSTRRIRDGSRNDVIVIRDPGCLRAYRTQNRHDARTTPICEAGVPEDTSDWLSLPEKMTDAEVLAHVLTFEAGHRRGWIDGRHRLKRDLRDLIGAMQG